MQTKLERLLRYHRQRVFDEKTGDAHARAIGRLKKTKTFRAMCEANRELESILLGAHLTNMGY
jgi:hypothetical protein